MKGFEDAFTDLQAEFVSLCMEYTNGNVDKIYIYIYQDTSQKMFNAIFVKGNDVIPAGNFADDEFLRSANHKLHSLGGRFSFGRPSGVHSPHDLP